MTKLAKSIRNFIIRDIIYILGGTAVILSFLHVWGKIDVSKKTIDITVIPKSANIIFYVLGIALAYAVGYCLQEVFSLLHIVKTANYFKPRFPLRWLYRGLYGERWTAIFPDIPKGRRRRWEVTKRLRQANIIINEKASQDDKIHREWTASFIMICTTLGPCALVSGLLLLWKCLPTFLKNNPEIVKTLGEYVGNSLELAFLAIAAIIMLLIITKLSVLLIPFAFIAIIVFSKNLTFDMALTVSVILIGMALIILGWLKGLEQMKNTEVLYQKLQEHNP
jgi:hypothetical protein